MLCKSAQDFKDNSSDSLSSVVISYSTCGFVSSIEGGM